MPSLNIVADAAAHEPAALSDDRRVFQLKERVTASDVRDPRLAAQLIRRIGWALPAAEKAESDGTRRASCP